MGEQIGPKPEYYRIPTMRTLDGRRQFGQPELVTRDAQPEASSDRTEPVLAGGGLTEIAVRGGFRVSPIRPERFHKAPETPEFEIFTPERPGLAASATK